MPTIEWAASSADRTWSELWRQQKGEPPLILGVDDGSISDRLLAELRRMSWVDVLSADFIVRDRVVHLWLSDDQPREERLIFHIAAENPAVRRVEEHLVGRSSGGAGDER